MREKRIKELLGSLYDHRDVCERVWLDHVEHDRPEAEDAYNHIAGVEEAVQIVRAWAEEIEREDREDMLHDILWAVILSVVLVCGMMVLWR